MAQSDGQTLMARDSGLSALGVVYTLAWSLSFYPQLLLNYRRQAVTGVAVDFLLINPTGFLCYFLSNVALFASPVVRDEYRARYDGHEPQVRVNDIVFAGHAFVISALTFSQCFVYERDNSQRPSLLNRAFLVFVVVSVLALSSAAGSRLDSIEWLDVVNYLSYLKLYISFSKYVPQVKLNWQRQSTVGWSIANILLDMTGGTLSLAQLVLDSWIADDWQAITGNPGKLGLSLLSLCFDLVFVVQHFVLYRGNEPDPTRSHPRNLARVKLDEARQARTRREAGEETDLHEDDERALEPTVGPRRTEHGSQRIPASRDEREPLLAEPCRDSVGED
ncbi:hypothetical protein JCM10212_000433 [Sporobolomyces blumeae]